MNGPLTWRDAQDATDHLSPAERRTLLLLARMPLLWIDVIQSIEGLSGPSSIYRTLNRLRSAGLVASLTPALGVLPAQRVWHVTALGLAVVAIDQDVEFSALARQFGVSHAKLASLVAGLPHRAILYSLVAAIAISGLGRPELLAWEQPWRGRFWPAKAKSPLTIRLPAYVAMGWDKSSADFLLMADTGDLPLKAHRSMLIGLARWRTAGSRVPSIVVHTSTIERSRAWEILMEDIGRQHGGESLPCIPFMPEALDDDLRLDILERGGEPRPLLGRAT